MLLHVLSSTPTVLLFLLNCTFIGLPLLQKSKPLPTFASKLFTMDAQILTLERELAYYKAKSQECTDIIKLLSGYVPNQFAVTFSVNKNPVVSFDVGVLEMNFSIGIFMSWHTFFMQRIREHQTMLASLRAVPVDNYGR